MNAINQPKTPNHMLACKLAEAGLPVFPCWEKPKAVKDGNAVGLKSPRTKNGFKDATTDLRQVHQWWTTDPDAVVGLRTGSKSGLSVLDGDVEKETGKRLGEEQLVRLSLVHADAVKVRTQSGGVQYIFKHVEGASTSHKQVASHIDTRGEGGYIIAPGSIMANGATYVYEGRQLSEALELGDLPEFPLSACEAAIASRKAEAKQSDESRREAPFEDLRTQPPTEATRDEKLAVLRAMLAEAPNTLHRNDWAKLAFSLKAEFGETLRSDFVDFSMRYAAGSPCAEADALHVWNTANNPDDITSAAPALALLKKALGEKRNRAIWRSVLQHRDNHTSDGKPRPNQAVDVDLSHDKLAMDMGASGWDKDARYVAVWGKWLFWTGAHWAVDERLEHMTRTRSFLRTKALECGGKAGTRQADTLRSKHTVAAVAEFARSNPKSATAPDRFDTHVMLLGTPGGTVDLRTGETRTATRDDMITKQTAVAPAPLGVQPRLWLRFLSEIFADDQEIIDFMQRAAGYALTGQTSEHKMLFLYGTGRNGKSVFLNTLFDLWGNYARRASSSTFLNAQNQGHPTDLAGLQGARLVVGSELPAGKTWDESVIKDLTGGDVLTARYMRGDFFDYQPQLTLMIAGNTQPSFRGVDEAIRSRVALVPFTVTIPPEKRDRRLQEKLKAEAPAILRWAIDGALQWQRRGLDVPSSISVASAEYFEAEDTIGNFLADEAVDLVGHFETSKSIHLRFSQWCETQGLAQWTQLTLIKELRRRGYESGKSNGQRGLKGLKLT